MILDPHWETLREHAGRLRATPLRDLVRGEAVIAGRTALRFCAP